MGAPAAPSGSAPVASGRRAPAGFTLLLILPMINAIADATTNSLSWQSLDFGMVRGVFIALFLIAFAAVRPMLGWVATAAYILLAYQLCLVLLGSDVLGTLEASYIKVALSTLMILPGMRLIDTLHAFQRVNLAQYLGGLIILGYLAVSHVLGIGESEYVADTLYMGGAQVQVSYTLALLFVLALFATHRSHGWRRAMMGLAAAGAFVAILLILRRGALAGMGAGIVVYVLLSSRRTLLLKRMVIPILLAACALLATADIFKERFAARSLENRPLSEEARVFETFRVIDDLSRGSTSHILFGAELYNSPAYFDVRRQLHVDYNILLHGSGVIGLALYFAFHLAIVGCHLRWRGGGAPTDLSRDIDALFWAVLSMSLVISLSGSLTSMGYRSALFLTLGGILGMERSMRSRASAPLKPTAIAAA